MPSIAASARHAGDIDVVDVLGYGGCGDDGVELAGELVQRHLLLGENPQGSESTARLSLVRRKPMLLLDAAEDLGMPDFSGGLPAVLGRQKGDVVSRCVMRMFGAAVAGVPCLAILAVFGWVTAAQTAVPTAAAAAAAPGIKGSAGSFSVAGVLTGVAAVSATEVWAVGTAYGKSGFTSLITRWNGRTWRQLPVPGSGLAGVAAVSASDVWAVGSKGGKTLTLRWNGKTWKQVPSPTPAGGGDLVAVAATSAGNAWAVGSTASNKALILRWNGTVWKQVSSPGLRSISSLSGVTAISARSAWAVGGIVSGSDDTFILRWNGTAWKRVASPPFPRPIQYGGLQGVTGTSARNLWAVGFASPGADPYSAKTVVLHWNGFSWKRIASPDRPSGGSYLSAVTATAARSAWAVGVNEYEGNPPQPYHSHLMIEHWNGATWTLTRTSLPALSFLTSVAATSIRNAWAVGQTNSNKTLILHWNGTTWG